MMREDVLEQYDVDASGRIKSPGKFEGEMIYLPYFWQASLEWGEQPNRNGVFSIKIEATDRDYFPEIPKHKRRIRFYEREDGFVCEI